MKNNILLIALSSILLLTACNSNKETENHTDEHHTEKVEHDTHTDNHINQRSGVDVDNVFIRASFAGQDVASAFFTMHNHGDTDLQVKSISSNVSDATEFHTMEMKDSKMIMRTMDTVIIPAQGKLVLSPGADHVMLLNLKESLAVDQEVVLTVEFTDGSTQEIKGIAQDSESTGTNEEMNQEHGHHEHTDHTNMDHE